MRESGSILGAFQTCSWPRIALQIFCQETASAYSPDPVIGAHSDGLIFPSRGWTGFASIFLYFTLCGSEFDSTRRSVRDLLRPELLILCRVSPSP